MDPQTPTTCQSLPVATLLPEDPGIFIFSEWLTDGVARIIFVSAIFPIYLMLWLGFEATPVSRVAPTQGLLKDAQLTELPRRGILLERVKCV